MNRTKSKTYLTALGAVSLLASCAIAATVTLDATADHSGLVENNANAVSQYDRADTLWGVAGNDGFQRNGLVQFAAVPASVQADLLAAGTVLNSVTLELWSGGPDWAETSLKFMRLNDADADWTGGVPDDGTEGLASWSDKVESSGTDWSGNVAGGGSRGQIFGTLTSESMGIAFGATKWDVPLSGSEIIDWLTNPAVVPNLLVEEVNPGSGSQSRFATINSADTDDEFAPNLVIDYSVVPEPAAMGLLGTDLQYEHTRSIITNLFHPNKEIAPQYQAFNFTLNSGEVYTAIIANETQTDVTIRMLGGLEKTFPRSDVSSMKGLGISLMPEGLEATLTLQETADLLAYIAK